MGPLAPLRGVPGCAWEFFEGEGWWNAPEPTHRLRTVMPWRVPPALALEEPGGPMLAAPLCVLCSSVNSVFILFSRLNHKAGFSPGLEN
jgi:hypothetical protein